MPSSTAPSFPASGIAGVRGPSFLAALLATALLVVVQLKVKNPMILAERFVPGAGWAQIGVMAVYAAWITGLALDPARTARVRSRIWSLFSLLFFSQLVLGLLGIRPLLMTGKLHIPVPAMIVAGPLYRHEGFFMPILFGATLLVVGPAWCSWLCYIGAWDNAASRLKRQTPLPALARQGGGARRWIRPANLLLVVAAAVVLRAAGVPTAMAAGAGALFGLGGVAVMLFWSRRTGEMAHCAWYCPMGLISTRLGRFLPFSLRINAACTACGACSLACRYDALTVVDVAAGRPGWSCTLCGDCQGACRHGAIDFHCAGLRPRHARTLFIVLVVALHTVFLAVARI